MSLEGIGSIVSIIGIVGTIWKVSTAYSEMQHKLEMDQEKQSLILHQLGEKFGHFSNRFRDEVNEVDDRVCRVEDFLIKHHNYERR
jgi:hypothetical protein